MKAVFLDAATFAPQVTLTQPNRVSQWHVFDATAYTTEAIVERLKDADIAILNKVPIGEAELAQLPKLRLIQVTATGTDIIDHNACTQRGITIQNVAGYSTDSVADHAWMLILAAMRGLTHYARQSTDGSWQQDGRFSLNALPILELRGRTLGILGAGEIGRRVAEIGQAFGMNILFAERRGKTPRNPQYSTFEHVLATSNILSLHTPLTPDTHEMINASSIALMQQKPLLVNLARGAVVNDHDVAAAVERGDLFGYASDVFTPEPPTADNPLLALKDHPRVILTPHNAWASIEAQQRLWAQLCQHVDQFIGAQS